MSLMILLGLYVLVVGAMLGLHVWACHVNSKIGRIKMANHVGKEYTPPMMAKAAKKHGYKAKLIKKPGDDIHIEVRKDGKVVSPIYMVSEDKRIAYALVSSIGIIGGWNNQGVMWDQEFNPCPDFYDLVDAINMGVVYPADPRALPERKGVSLKS